MGAFSLIVVINLLNRKRMYFSENSVAAAYRRFRNKDFWRNRTFQSAAGASIYSLAVTGVYVKRTSRHVASGVRMALRTGVVATVAFSVSYLISYRFLCVPPEPYYRPKKQANPLDRFEDLSHLGYRNPKDVLKVD